YANDIEHWCLIHDQVVVDTREDKHQHKSDHQPADLLGVHANKGTAVRRGIDFHDAQRADGGDNGQQPPVVISCSCRFVHRVSIRTAFSIYSGLGLPAETGSTLAAAGSGFTAGLDRSAIRPLESPSRSYRLNSTVVWPCPFFAFLS